MNKFLVPGAFAAGLLALAWVAAGYIGTHALALAVTLVITAFYLAGAAEVQRHRRATAALQAALQSLTEAPVRLDDWLQTLPGALRRPVQLRVQAQRGVLPGPALTPYLVGLLVLLGMLGTFVGMVVTLNGTVTALEVSTELDALRAALAAPVKGLGAAFGTSVAGVCASAMLGLMSSLARRERLQAAAGLDDAITGPLHAFTGAQRREQGLQALQDQARLLPQLVDRMDALLSRLQQQHDAGTERWLAAQERWQQQAQATHAALAADVGRSLQSSLAEGSRLATEALAPFARDTLGTIARDAATLHGDVARRIDGQVQALVDGVGGHTRTLSQAVEARHAELLAELSARFESRSEALAQRLDERQQAQLAALAAQEAQRTDHWQRALAEATTALRDGWQRAGADTLAQQQAICQTLEQTAGRVAAQAQADAQATLAEMARLSAQAAEAPRRAAEVMAAMQQHLADGLARDTAQLDERQRLLLALSTLLDTLQQQADRQQAATEQLLTQAQAVTERAGAQLGQAVAEGTAALAEASAQATAGAVEMASVGEAFGGAVQRFGESGDRLLAHLQQVEQALERATVRSDEQLAYYVAQARELIDLTLLSQKQMVDEMRRLARDAAAAPAEAG